VFPPVIQLLRTFAVELRIILACGSEFGRIVFGLDEIKRDGFTVAGHGHLVAGFRPFELFLPYGHPGRPEKPVAINDFDPVTEVSDRKSSHPIIIQLCRVTVKNSFGSGIFHTHPCLEYTGYMKILILGSVALPVPPPMQGGTERIAYWQATGLAKRGHEVTLIAARGSRKEEAYALVEIGGGDTVAGSSKERVGTEFTEGSRNLRKELIYMADVCQWVADHGRQFDCILNNMRGGESVLLPVIKLLGMPFATVMHLPLFSELAELFWKYHTPVITISNAQREGFDGLTYAGTVYNATDLRELPFQEVPEDYLLMMGSIAPHKNQKDGILAAKSLGKKIILAGKIGNTAYFESEIAPFVDGTTVVHKGELDILTKATLLGGAQALLFPIKWPEPFGLVMIEAMAAGTPVVAYRNGAVPEVVVNGKTGFITDPSDGPTGMVAALSKIEEIDRAACRKHVEEHFTISKMLDSLETALRGVASA